MKLLDKHGIRAVTTGLLLSLAGLTPLLADDTEIFFGQARDSFNNNPNILFVLDNSGSMTIEDEGFNNISRIDRMKTAMSDLLDESSSYNVGLMAFQGIDHGGVIRFPVGFLEADSTELCDGVCPDELIVSRPDGGGNDGTEHDTTKENLLSSATLVLTNVESVAATTTETTVVETSLSAVATADVSEYTPSDVNSAINQNNQPINRWFYDGVADHGIGHYAYRFDDVQIPKGATVTQAKITFTRTSIANQPGEVSVYISAEATPAPQAYPTGSNATLTLAERRDPLRRTRALVGWDLVPPDNSPGASAEPDASAKIDTPDLASVMAELVSQPGWVTGGSVSFLIDPYDTYTASAADIREFHGSTATATHVPVLSYTYHEAPNPDLTRTTVAAFAHVDEITAQNTEAVSRNTANEVSQLFHAGTTNRPRQLALRFDGINIPSDAIIKNAYLTLTGAPASASAPPDTDWTAVDGSGNGLAPASTSAVSPATSGTTSEATVSANIQAELTPTPADYSTTTLDERTHTSTFINWANIPDAADAPDMQRVSPDLSILVAEVISLADWNSGDSISLRLSAPESAISSADNIRNVLTAAATDKPELLITWEANDTNTGTAAQTQTAAIRFSEVHIPPGATIKSAKMVFHSAAASDEATSLDISAEKIASSLPLAATVNDIGLRARTVAQETWQVDPWLTVGTAFDSPDVARIVQELTDQPDWCGGNPMTFFLAGSGKRVAVSADANTIKAPTLEIVYSPDSVATGGYCSNSSVTAQIVEASNDAVQNIVSKDVRLNGNSLQTDSNNDGSGDKQIIGLRFDNVKIPPNSDVISATLRLTTDAPISDTAQFTIRIEEADNPSVFTTNNDNIGSRAWSTSEVVWDSMPPVAANESSFTSDLKPLITQAVAGAGWQSGNAMAFRLEPAQTGNHRSFTAFDTNEANSAQLLIYFKAERTSPGTRFRDNLKQHVNELVAKGHTPITSSLYEAAQYFRSEPVDYGRRRGQQTTADRFHRVSHPFSYEGGDLSRPAECTDADLDSEACIMEVINNNTSTPTYISPMDSQCQTNHIVLLSDGRATSNSAATRIKTMTGGDCDTGYSDSEECGRELVEWMNVNDHSAFLPGTQNITTHTIAFNLAEADRGFLTDLAALGGGGAYVADSANSLLSAFKSIFRNVSKTNTSFVAPTVTLNHQNRMKNREDLYYAMFKPESTARWNGNLKKFKLQGVENSDAIIVDQNLLPAVDETTGNFKDGSRSFWSMVTDGSDVKLGGAASRLKDDSGSHLSRNVYTYTGTTTDLTHIDNQLLPGNTHVKPDWFSLSATLAADTVYYEKLVNWTHGKDVLDVDSDGNTDEPRGQMGDPLHAQPVLLTYGTGTSEKSIVFVATNEGFLHAMDSETGDEKFAFIPRELLKNMHKLLTNEPTLRRPYGLDGGMTTWLQDDNKNGVIDAGEKAYLYIAMRRGGSQYYALDISDFNSPKFMWSIQGRTGDFVELGDTWSRPVKTRVRDGSALVDVLVFGGGYDPNQDPAASSSSSVTSSLADSRSTDGVGRAIFVVNATTGAKLWQTSRLSPEFGDMNYSIPSEIRVIDIDFDGLADQLYVGDMGGQIFRLDINNDASLTGTLSTRISGDRIADLAGDDPVNARRFYYPPDISIISVDGQQQLAISIGSGWRAHPLDEIVQDRFYSLRLNSVYGKPIDSFGVTRYPEISTGELVNVSTDIAATIPEEKQGWFMDMPGSGEKVLSASVTADHKLLFTTYLPDIESVACSAAEGSGAVYAVSVLNGAPVLDLDQSGAAFALTISDRSRILNHAGIPASTSVLFPETGDATVVVGTEKLQEFKLDNLRRRTFWQEKLEEDS